MIAEAYDTVVTLGWALAAWIVALAAVATLALWTVAVTIAAAVRGLSRALSASVAAVQHRNALREGRGAQNAVDARTAARVSSGAPCAVTGTRHSAPQTPDAPFPASAAARPPQSRTGRQAPSWAQPEQDAAA